MKMKHAQPHGRVVTHNSCSASLYEAEKAENSYVSSYYLESSGNSKSAAFAAGKLQEAWWRRFSGDVGEAFTFGLAAEALVWFSPPSRSPVYYEA